MATIRRLSDTDVRSIFESLHHNRPPPPHLKFHIVAVNSNGLKLSPPSYEFEDGLYVLLKPQKKGQSFPNYSKVPQHLMGLIESKYTNENCPWSLSGPQFPQPTAIQQRYCYPKGEAEYSGKKGGALWTMYGTDGKEDLEFRLLHVYFSAKRAVNKGKGSRSPSIKRPKRTHVSTPRSRIVAAARGTPELASPAITASSGTSSLCTSPRSYSSTSPESHGSLPALNSTNYIGFSDTDFDDLFLSRSFHPVGPGLQYAGSFGDYDFNQSNTAASNDRVAGVHSIMRSPPRVSNKMITIPEENNKTHASGDVEMKDAHNELDPFSMHDPLLAIMMTPSEDQPSEVNLANHLDYFHRSVRNMIVKSPAKDQAALVSSFSEWAKHISKDPLERKGLAKRDV